MKESQWLELGDMELRRGSWSLPDHSSSVWTEGVMKQDDVVRHRHDDLLDLGSCELMKSSI